MADSSELLLRRLLRAAERADGHDEQDEHDGPNVADADLFAPARDSTIPAVLVVAAVCGREQDATELLARARAGTATTRERQLVALAVAHLDGDHDRFDALVRDHLADHPDDVVAAWIAARHTH